MFRSVSSQSINLPTSHIIIRIRESPPELENQIMARVYERSITRSTVYQQAPFC